MAPTALLIVSLGQRPRDLGSRYGFSAEGAIHSGTKRRPINGEPDLRNLDKWYLRDEGTAAGDFRVYNVTLRP